MSWSSENEKLWFVFYCPRERVRGGKARVGGNPKQYWGPFQSKMTAEETVRDEMAQFETPRKMLVIKCLTPRGFADFWGAEFRGHSSQDPDAYQNYQGDRGGKSFWQKLFGG